MMKKFDKTMISEVVGGEIFIDKKEYIQALKFISPKKGWAQKVGCYFLKLTCSENLLSSNLKLFVNPL
jgi:predicted RNA-binding protein